MTDFLITGARGVFTGLPGESARATGGIRVRGGRIAELGDLTPEAGERVVDASGCVVTPGLVNTRKLWFSVAAIPPKPAISRKKPTRV